MLKNENYVLLQGWMAVDLGLKGNDLIVYGIIYGFSHVEGTAFTGSLQYLADWTGSTKSNVRRNINRLLEQSLLIKEDETINGVKFCKYRAVVPHIECTQNEHGVVNEGYIHNEHGVVESNTKYKDIYTNTSNNINNNNNNNNNNTNKLNTIFNNKEKKHKNTIAQDLEKAVNEYTTNEELRQALMEFIQMRKDLKSPIKTLNGFKRLLGTLNKLAPKAEDKIKIVNQSLDHEWKSFYELKTNQLSYKNKNMNNGYLVGNYKPTEKTLKELHKRDNEEIEWSDEVF